MRRKRANWQLCALLLPVAACADQLLTIRPAKLEVVFRSGQPPPARQTLVVATNGASSPFTAAITEGEKWLSVSPASGATPATLVVSVTVAGLSPGVHNGVITVSAAGASNSPVAVPVTLAIVTAPALSVSHRTLFLTGQASEFITVTSAGGPLSFTTQVYGGGSWLSVSPDAGATPSSLAVTTNPAGLSPGLHHATIAFSAPGSAQSVAVTLSVQPATAPHLSVSPSSAYLTCQKGDSPPPVQAIFVSSDGGALNFTASVSGGWLTLSPTTGATPAAIMVSINPYGLSPGTYTAVIIISSPGASNNPQMASVTLAVQDSP